MRVFNLSYIELRKTHISIINWLFKGTLRVQARLNYNDLTLNDFKNEKDKDSRMNYITDLEIVMYEDKERKVGYPHYVYSFYKD